MAKRKKEPSEECKRICRRLKEERKKRALTREEVEGVASVSYLGKVERGEANPSLDWLIQHCKGIGIDLSELLEEKEEGDHRAARRRAEAEFSEEIMVRFVEDSSDEQRDYVERAKELFHELAILAVEMMELGREKQKEEERS